MLGALISILKPAIEAALLVAVIISFLKKVNKEINTRGVWAALAVAILIGFLAVYQFDFWGDREAFEAYLLVLATVGSLILGFWTWFTVRRAKHLVGQSIIFITLIPLLVTKTVDMVMFPTTVFIMNTVLINSELIFKITGVLLGVIIAMLFGWAFTKANQTLKLSWQLAVLEGFLLVMFIRQTITLVQLLLALGYLPATPWLISIIAPVINYYYPGFFYVLLILGGGALILNFRAVPAPNSVAVDSLNPAQRRKVFARIRLDKSWIKGASCVLAGIFILLGVNLAYANREVKLSPPIPLKPNGQHLEIQLETINDGKLHRFSFVTLENITMRFIVIKKSEKSYGVGLDACQICGVAGYYQRGKDIICKNCDVVINIPTIGFPGGCNPIPLNSKVETGSLVIQTGDLEGKAEVFK